MAKDKVNIIAGLFNAFNFETITISTTAKSLTASKYTKSSGETFTEYARKALITVEDAQLRFRFDGGTPTASVGHLLTQKDSITLIGAYNIKNFKAIRKGSSDSKISVTYQF